MGDLWAQSTPQQIIERILMVVQASAGATYLMLTKNPRRYLELAHMMPRNVVLGATIETDRYPETSEPISLAPQPTLRCLDMDTLRDRLPHIPRMVCIEPVIDFDLDRFAGLIFRIKPIYVYIGYDNHGHKLPEPPLEKTQKLIDILKGFTQVRTKTLRNTWND